MGTRVEQQLAFDGKRAPPIDSDAGSRWIEVECEFGDVALRQRQELDLTPGLLLCRKRIVATAQGAGQRLHGGRVVLVLDRFRRKPKQYLRVRIPSRLKVELLVELRGQHRSLPAGGPIVDHLPRRSEHIEELEP